MNEPPRVFPSWRVLAAFVALIAFIVLLTWNERRIQRQNAKTAERRRPYEPAHAPRTPSGGAAMPQTRQMNPAELPPPPAELPQACREYLVTLARLASCTAEDRPAVPLDHRTERDAVVRGERTESHCRLHSEAWRTMADAIGCAP